LTVTGLVTAGSATITGDLTVDTSTLKVDSTNNRVIVGHTSGSAAFQVTNAGAAGLEIQPTGFSSSPLIQSYNRSGSAYTQLTLDASTIVHALSGSTAMTLNSTGLGIGAVPSNYRLYVSAAFASGLNGAYIESGEYDKKSLVVNHTNASVAVNLFEVQKVGTALLTLDATGNLLVGLTVDTFAPAKGVSMFAGNSSRVAVGHANGTTSGDYYHSFAYNSTVIGSITQNGTTGVLFNTSSDYRLKDSVKPLSGGLARVNALKPSSYNWKSDGSTGEGFLAHELAEVVPFAVSGEKDAVNADGSIKSQGIDMSRVVPILVAAIQELTAEVNALKNA
jgi:hypothetical protein